MKLRKHFKFFATRLNLPIFPKIRVIKEGKIYKVKKGMYTWYIPSNNWHQMIWALDFMKYHERFLDSFTEGDIVVEVGATTGECTIPIAHKIGEIGQIYAFEADPIVYLCLEKNLEMNHIVNVKAVNKAVSDESNKELQLYFRRDSMAEASFHRVYLPNKLIVKTTSLDDYITSIGISHVDVIKVTVNGHEPEVLKGAKNLLGGVRVIIFQSARYKKVISFLKQKGFKIRESFNVGKRSEKAILMEK